MVNCQQLFLVRVVQLPQEKVLSPLLTESTTEFRTNTRLLTPHRFCFFPKLLKFIIMRYFLFFLNFVDDEHKILSINNL